ncbi:hypothetical protein JIN77_09450 [Verrucomicrobiaceae bacterium R5-34]|nr:hypothetical protein [Verrucomicrobiaceae bacterium R5-34]
MKQIFDPVVSTATDLAEAAKKVADDGIGYFRSRIGSLPLVASVLAQETSELTDRDESHYFLVPYRLSPCAYALVTRRVLPIGVGPENALPKARIFHLPAEGTAATLEALITEQLSKENKSSMDFSAPLVDRLDLMADEIDKQSNLITGGLVVIGGVVAVVNPLLGVGIAAKAILPTLSSKLSKHGLNHVSDWLRTRKVEKDQQQAIVQATKELKRIQPEIVVDHTLALLEESLASEDPHHDPQLPCSSQLDTPGEALKLKLTAQAISDVYATCLADASSHREAKLHAPDLAWLQSLNEIAQA